MMSDALHSPQRRPDPRPLIAHIVYRFGIGGLENGIVNLVNGMPESRYRHAIVALTEVTDFRARIARSDVAFVELNKGPGHALPLYPKLFSLFRRLAPAIVHTRNLAALEATVPAWLAGVRVRVHGEHGRDMGDITGSGWRRRWIRHLYRPFVTRYVAVSSELEHYLNEVVGIPGIRVERICNGVDTRRFAPAPGDCRMPIDGCPFRDPGAWLVGTVGRMDYVKDQRTLIHAFAAATRKHPRGDRMRLLIVGDGPARTEIEAALQDAKVKDRAWLPGERSDVADILRGLDCFVLPSLAEGISNTVLEAMATALPIIATRVGGNSELLDESTACLVSAGDANAIAQALHAYFDDRSLARRHAQAARLTAVQRYSLDGMVSRYVSLYDRLLARGHALALGTDARG
jgi:sugar transferase (PEP-CTERM/EpsH1 system associated)